MECLGWLVLFTWILSALATPTPVTRNSTASDATLKLRRVKRLSAGDAVAVGQAITSALKGEGKNLRSLESPLGCLDGGFSSDMDHDLWNGIKGNCERDLYSFGAFTVGYWEECRGSSPWQRWTLDGGKLYTSMGVKYWGAWRCLDAFGAVARADTMGCAYDCWGGEGQEMIVTFAYQAADSATREAAFFIKPRAAQDRCLTYNGNNNPIRFRPCDSNNRAQMWFIPGELPLN